LAAGPAAGQTFGGTGDLKLPPMARELGLSGGGFLFLPTLKLGYGYDSNVFLEDSMAGQEEPNGSQLVDIRPGIELKNRNRDNLSLDFRGGGLVRQYLTGNDVVSEHGDIGGDVGLRVGFLESGPLSLRVKERFQRVLERRTFETTRKFNRHVNDVGAGMTFQPGGRALQLNLDYSFVADLMTDTSADWGDLIFHDVMLQGSWKFFPFTALVLEANWQYRDYLMESRGFYGELTDNFPLRIRAGVNGFITPKLSVLGLIGYGNSFHEVRPMSAAEAAAPAAQQTPNANDSFNMVLGEVRVSFKPTETTILQASYRYDFQDSVFTNYAAYHKLVANFQQRLFGRFDLVVDVGYFDVFFSQIPFEYLHNSYDSSVIGFNATGTGYREDRILMGALRGILDINRLLAFELSYNVELFNEPLNSDGKFYTCLEHGCNSPDVIKDSLAYQRHLVMGTLTLRY
jgi:hypothetical protein